MGVFELRNAISDFDCVSHCVFVETVIKASSFVSVSPDRFRFGFDFEFRCVFASVSKFQGFACVSLRFQVGFSLRFRFKENASEVASVSGFGFVAFSNFGFVSVSQGRFGLRNPLRFRFDFVLVSLRSFASVSLRVSS